ncbi:MAG: acyl carrier protein, partial [Okeania sp. SIO4D6]|nr:acyl carrier protein [Okeania sp. SIO4D6]
DSLMAVELKNRLELTLQTSLSSTLLFDYPTLEALVEHLADVIPLEFSVTDNSDKSNNMSRFEEMSEDQMFGLLAQTLESIGGKKIDK